MALINFYECRGWCDRIAGRILGELNAIMRRLDSLLSGYDANFGIVGLVIADRTAGLGDSGVQGIFASILAQVQEYEKRYGDNVAVFVVWTDASGQVWYACFGSACEEMTSSQRQRFACMLAGQGPGCGARQVVYAPPMNGLLPPPPPPPPSQEEDDKDPTVGWDP